MLKVSYAACFGLSVLTSAQFALEMCLAAQNRQKIHKPPLLRSSKVIALGYVEAVVRRLTACLVDIEAWLKASRLRLNSAKTQTHFP